MATDNDEAPIERRACEIFSDTDERLLLQIGFERLARFIIALSEAELRVRQQSSTLRDLAERTPAKRRAVRRLRRALEKAVTAANEMELAGEDPGTGTVPTPVSAIARSVNRRLSEYIEQMDVLLTEHLTMKMDRDEKLTLAKETFIRWRYGIPSYRHKMRDMYALAQARNLTNATTEESFAKSFSRITKDVVCVHPPPLDTSEL